ncbi:MAG: S-methyl-5-thioribose-1-phosphate isomerase [Thermoprotei archaeon]|nr:MAG: S-methyl-5-thioribose-1-phosphate isomerase [Thermoprotei archaeon]RLF00418.1 MAG: S-methyl-5-thioribose-1-phosphate isomerase [Thermoprotei archaeon]
MNKNSLQPLIWKDGTVLILNQTLLPDELEYIETTDPQRVAKAIKTMEVRGAPAIGVAAALGVALAAYHSKASSVESLRKELLSACETLWRTRPTARNLFWAIERMKNIINKEYSSTQDLKDAIIKEALKILEEDIETNRRLGKIGSKLLEDGDTVLTHCNAGALATAGYGTALGVIRAAIESGKHIKVVATETRPLLQGARLTCFELMYDGIDVTLITDNMVGYVISKGLVDKIIVGADRILKDGHVINKIGTYTIACVAHTHKVPFYVAAPLSTFDLKSKVEEVIIENRDPSEVTTIRGVKIAPKGIKVLNPAFDITPPDKVSAIITEKGIAYPPYEESIKKLFETL